jgi:hypothetical protein
VINRCTESGSLAVLRDTPAVAELVKKFLMLFRTHKWQYLSKQLDALFQCIYLFHFSTCFEQPSAHHQENQLYQYIIWYVGEFDFCLTLHHQLGKVI